MASRPNPPKERLATPGPPNVVTNGIGEPGARPSDEAECCQALPRQMTNSCQVERGDGGGARERRVSRYRGTLTPFWQEGLPNFKVPTQAGQPIVMLNPAN